MVPKILIVDDEAPIRTLLRSAVATPGVVVVEADGGQHALETASREGPFCLVVTDVLMPGMDGFTLAQELSRAGHARNFVFMSGYYDEEEMMHRLEAFPGAAFLTKPFPIPALLQALRRALPVDNLAPGAKLRRSA